MDDDDDDRLHSDEDRKVLLEDIRETMLSYDSTKALAPDIMKDLQDCGDYELIQHHTIV